MKKTSYFKFDYDKDIPDGYRRCEWCGEIFRIPTSMNGYKTIYCSDDCYEDAMREKRRIWRVNNDEHNKFLKRRWYEKHRRKPSHENLKPPKQYDLMAISAYRRKYIRQQIILMELYDEQIKENDTHVDYSGHRLTRPDTGIIDFIVEKLKRRGLYETHEREIDFSDDYIFDEHMLD